MLNISKIISKFTRNSSQRKIDKLKLVVNKINDWEAKVKSMPDDSFPKKSEEFKLKCAREITDILGTFGMNLCEYIHLNYER